MKPEEFRIGFRIGIRISLIIMIIIGVILKESDPKIFEAAMFLATATCVVGLLNLFKTE